MNVYQPPFHMNENITSLIIDIGEYVGTVTAYETLHPNPLLRRQNRIQSIHSSLSIEANSLTIDQVTAIIDGKRVLGPAKDIQEVKNAYQAYNKAIKFNPYKIEDLLKAHKIMMAGLIKEAGVFRLKNAGIYSGTTLIHAGTPAKYVPELMTQLMNWLKTSKYHPLVKSCIFHYEFEFIHPFADGNGRMGRLWQSLILYKWKEFFAYLPVENLVRENQREYYKALQLSNNDGESTIFVEFMLKMIHNSLKELSEKQQANMNVATNVVANVATNVVANGYSNEESVLRLLKQDGHLTAKVIASTLNLTPRQAQRILAKLKSEGKITRHGATKNGYWQVEI